MIQQNATHRLQAHYDAHAILFRSTAHTTRPRDTGTDRITTEHISHMRRNIDTDRKR